MNILKLTTVSISFILLSIPLRGAAPDTLTLDFCLQRATESYPTIKQKPIWTESADLKYQNTNKSWLPQFDVNGRATYQSDVTEVPVNVPGVNIPSPDRDVYDLFLGLSQMIWDGGVSREQKKIDQADLQVNQQQVEVDLYKIKSQINGLFFKIILLQKSKEILELNRRTVNDKLKEITSGVNSGMVLQSNADVLQAQVIQINQNIIEIDADQKAAMQMLGEFLDMAIPPGAFLVLPDPEVETGTYLNQRPEYLLFDLQKDKLDATKNLLTAVYFPKLNGFGKAGYGKPALDMLSTSFDTYYVVGVGLSWDILNWNKKKNQLKLADLQKNIIETQKEAFDKNVKIKVRDDVAQIQKYSDLIVNDEALISLRDKIVKAASSQLDNGVITSTQYLDELNKATRARFDLETHRIQLSFARITYLNTIGKQ